MAKVIITTKLWDMKANKWYKVHQVTFNVSDEEAKSARDVFTNGSGKVYSDNPSIYKQHIQFTTEMEIENDKGICIGGFVNY